MNTNQRQALADRIARGEIDTEFEHACDEAYQLTDDEARSEILDEGWTSQTQGWTEVWEVWLGDNTFHVFFCEDQVLTICDM